MPEFISQRRRWLNGAFFAAVYSLVHFRQIWTTDHTLWRKILLHIEFVYQLVSLGFTYFSLVSGVLRLHSVCMVSNVSRPIFTSPSTSSPVLWPTHSSTLSATGLGDTFSSFSDFPVFSLYALSSFCLWATAPRGKPIIQPI